MSLNSNLILFSNNLAINAGNVVVPISQGGTGGANAVVALNNMSYLVNTTGGAVRPMNAKLSDVVSVKDFGAVGNVVSLTPVNVTISSSTNTLTVTGGSFTSADVGKAIEISGAGSGGNPLITTISGVTSATQVTLASNASTSLSSSSQNVFYGNDDTSAVQAAVNYLISQPTAGIVYFPRGTYWLGSSITATFTDNRYASIGFVGEGSEAALLFWPSSNGIAITLHHPNQSFRVRDLTLMTGTSLLLAPNYTALAITGPATTPSTQSDISGVTFRGINGSVFFWQTNINVYGTGLVSFNNLWFPSPLNGNIIGVIISSGTPVGLGESVYNFYNCNWSGGGKGIVWGNYIQGMTINQCTFGGLYNAVYCSSGTLGSLGGLEITSSQFNCYSTAVYINNAFSVVSVANNYFELQVAGSQVLFQAISTTGINIVGNQFWNNAGTGTNGIGVYFLSGCLMATVVGNCFTGLGTAVRIESGASNITVQSNSYYNNGTPYVNLGSNNSIGGGSI